MLTSKESCKLKNKSWKQEEEKNFLPTSFIYLYFFPFINFPAVVYNTNNKKRFTNSIAWRNFPLSSSHQISFALSHCSRMLGCRESQDTREEFSILKKKTNLWMKKKRGSSQSACIRMYGKVSAKGKSTFCLYLLTQLLFTFRAVRSCWIKFYDI